jgi:nitrogen regulatory protein P-II 1
MSSRKSGSKRGACGLRRGGGLGGSLASSLRPEGCRAWATLDMKKIETIIKPFQLEDVKSGLAEVGIDAMTVSEVKGFALNPAEQDNRFSLATPRFLPKLKVELIVRNELLGSAVAAIKQSARTGRREDHKVFVQDLLEVIRIRTEERGEQAI